eukprot:TRINITY_DN4054_c0_g1_i1.p1 TRINITY_DN4054_c0_g1~~TRINITY_DN4054_c0_g1_i1.p1  ORF type:complete len:279 (+),score=101.74 TRINITY_DN4054_c0_g1_i1:96-932(+)
MPQPPTDGGAGRRSRVSPPRPRGAHVSLAAQQQQQQPPLGLGRRASSTRASRDPLAQLRAEHAALQEHLKRLTEAADDYRNRVDACFSGARQRDAELSARRSVEEHRRALLDGERVQSDAQLQISLTQQRAAEQRESRLEGQLDDETRALGDLLAHAAAERADARRCELAAERLREEATEAAHQRAAAEAEAEEAAAELRGAEATLHEAEGEHAAEREREAAAAAAARACTRSLRRCRRAASGLCREVGLAECSARELLCDAQQRLAHSPEPQLIAAG